MLRKWRSRHRKATNLVLHLAGVPATIAAVPLAVLGYWLVAVGLFVAGYALQLLGHLLEGTRSGEERLLRRLLRRNPRS